MGVEVPRPGIFTFHFTPSVGVHLTRGSALGATPVFNGPRQLPQFSSTAAAWALTEAAQSKEITTDSRESLISLDLRWKDGFDRRPVTPLLQRLIIPGGKLRKKVMLV